MARLVLNRLLKWRRNAVFLYFRLRTIILDDFSKFYKKAQPDLLLIQGSEISCQYMFSDGKRIEIHVIVVFPGDCLDREQHFQMCKMFLRKNTYDRDRYIQDIINKLKISCGIDLGKLDELKRHFSDSTEIGRVHVARYMVEKQICSSVREAMDVYIGDRGKRLAYVENKEKENYVTLEEVVSMAHKLKAVPILCHVLLYNLTESEIHTLVRDFRRLAGFVGGMETEYAQFDVEIRKMLKTEYADKYDLFCSAASDFHSEENILNNGFPVELYHELYRRWKAFYSI